eukprot:gb/GECG01007383.1/.p1 GENE.gb/GECG01007383.1/~~gb/GECG01007383.1/.p1  ORF type:complete len:510 (+),score=44.31 gb/GECG01007383.1/:1-1530(+)
MLCRKSDLRCIVLMDLPSGDVKRNVMCFLGGALSFSMGLALYERIRRWYEKKGDSTDAPHDEGDITTGANAHDEALRRIAELEQRNRELDGQRYQERQGRIHSERALRKGSPFHYDANESLRSGASVNAFPTLAIGTLTTCFHLCKSTPRQGYIAPATRGIIMLHDGSNAVLRGRKSLGGWARDCQGQVPHVQDKVLREKQGEDGPTLQYTKGESQRNTSVSSGQGSISGSALDGLEQFSHVWIIYGFHSNTQLHKSHMAAHSRGYKFVAKINPPVLKGKKMGIFATRSPHRPSSIGLSVARVINVDKKQGWLHVSGVDMLDGTPVLDIKPYIPQYDMVQDAKIPKWVNDSAISRENQRPVYFAHRLCDDLNSISNHSSYCPSVLSCMENVVLVVEQVLSSDVRSSFQRGGADSQKGKSCEYELLLDGLQISYVECRGDNAVCMLQRYLIKRLMSSDGVRRFLKGSHLAQNPGSEFIENIDPAQDSVAIVTRAQPIPAKSTAPTVDEDS